MQTCKFLRKVKVNRSFLLAFFKSFLIYFYANFKWIILFLKIYNKREIFKLSVIRKKDYKKEKYIYKIVCFYYTKLYIYIT